MCCGDTRRWNNFEIAEIAYRRSIRKLVCSKAGRSLQSKRDTTIARNKSVKGEEPVLYYVRNAHTYQEYERSLTKLMTVRQKKLKLCAEKAYTKWSDNHDFGGG